MPKVKEKACKICKTIYFNESKCPNCGSKEFTDSFKGKMFLLAPGKSEIAKNLGMETKGEFAIKTR